MHSSWFSTTQWQNHCPRSDLNEAQMILYHCCDQVWKFCTRLFFVLTGHKNLWEACSTWESKTHQNCQSWLWDRPVGRWGALPIRIWREWRWPSFFSAEQHIFLAEHDQNCWVQCALVNRCNFWVSHFVHWYFFVCIFCHVSCPKTLRIWLDWFANTYLQAPFMIRISFTVDGALHIPLSTKLGTKSKLFLFFWCVVSCVYINLNIYIYMRVFLVSVYI